MRHHLSLLALAAALLTPLGAAAGDHSTNAGGYTIHHNAFTTETLTPEVASAYRVQRSKYRGMLNVSVVRNEAGTTGESVPARVEVHTVALTGQRSRLPMRELKDRDAYYYIGELSVRDQERVNFEIEVTPESSRETFKVRMDQQFFTN